MGRRRGIDAISLSLSFPVAVAVRAMEFEGVDVGRSGAIVCSSVSHLFRREDELWCVCVCECVSVCVRKKSSKV